MDTRCEALLIDKGRILGRCKSEGVRVKTVETAESTRLCDVDKGTAEEMPDRPGREFSFWVCAEPHDWSECEKPE